MNDPDALFYRRYQGVLDSRTIYQGRELTVVAGLGQMMPGSLLILPWCHYEKMAGLPSTAVQELLQLLQVLRSLPDRDNMIMFEHGARAESGGSCGIYHAHMHVMWPSRDLHPAEILPSPHKLFESTAAAIAHARLYDQYLFFANTAQAGVCDVAETDEPIASQYLRRRVAKSLQLDRDWDWRSYQDAEGDLVRTVQEFKPLLACISPER